MAQTADKLDCKGCVKSKQLKNGGIKGKDIKAGAVDGSKIADGSVDNPDIAGDAVDSLKVAPESLTALDLTDEAGGEFADNNTAIALTAADTIVNTLQVNAPGPGVLLVTASINGSSQGAVNSQVSCGLSTDGTLDSGFTYEKEMNPLSDSVEDWNLAVTRGFTIAADGVFTVNLVCEEDFGDATYQISSMTAVYGPTRY